MLLEPAGLGPELAEAGLRVVVLEEGGHHRTESFTTSTGEMLSRLYRDAGLSVILGPAPLTYAEGRCVGGSTVVNGEMTLRAPDRVLARWARTSGARVLAPEWMDDVYGRVERFLSVSPPDPGSIGPPGRAAGRGRGPPRAPSRTGMGAGDDAGRSTRAGLG